jgi:hypothetical protein
MAGQGRGHRQVIGGSLAASPQDLTGPAFLDLSGLLPGWQLSVTKISQSP